MGTSRPSEEHQTADKPRPRWLGLLGRWWFLIILLVAITELALHGWQTQEKMADDDWKQVRSAIESQVKPDDLVALSPSWLHPVGRMRLGDDIMTTRRVARADVDRFPRAFEVALGNSRHSELRDWPVEATRPSSGSFRGQRIKNTSGKPLLKANPLPMLKSARIAFSCRGNYCTTRTILKL